MYARALQSRPRLTKTVTACCIALAGDALAQQVGGEPYCPRRAGAFVLWAAATTPLLHSWYLLLQRSSPLRAALLDQFVWAPPSTAAFLFFTAAVCSPPGSHALQEGAARVVSHLPTTLAANWGVWLPVQLLNFSLVAPAYQILFTNLVGLGWCACLSYMTHVPRAAQLVEAPPDF
jgi:protein Mpv17